MESIRKTLLGRRGVLAWCFYDWANSAYVTSIVTALLPVYYLSLFIDKEHVTLSAFGRQWHTSGTALWSYSSGFYMLAAAAAAPVLGAMADSVRGKRWFLGGCVVVGATFTAALALVQPGQYLLCSVFYVVSGFAWTAANIFYDGFLPELGDEPAAMEAISSAGFSLGYLGGGLMLAANLVMVSSPEWFGLSTAGAARWCFVMVGAWWLVFTLPLLLRVRERNAGVPLPAGRSIVGEGFARVGRTIRRIGRLPNLMRFLIAFLLYNSGIGTLIIVAGVYAKDELNLPTSTILGCFLMIQFVGVPAAMAFIWISRKLGSRNAIALGIAIYMGVIVYAMNIHTPLEFWILGLLVALVQGGTQAISRSVFGSMIPQGLSAEFYGFFSVYDKVGAFAGPLLFGLFRDLTGSSRTAILFLIAFFGLGLAMLLTVRVRAGIEQAKAFRAEPQA